MDTYYDSHNDVDRDIQNSQSSESSNSSINSHESREERAARIRQNQRRCRERKLAYVASLEERLRVYEQNGVQANIHLQKLAKRLDNENRKLKRVLFDSCGLSDIDIERSDIDTLVEDVKSRFGAVQLDRSIASRSSSFSGAGIETSWSYKPSTAFPTCCYPSAPLSDVRSQKPPTPPPSKDDPVDSLLLTMAPQSKPNCGADLSASGRRFCGLLQLLATGSNISSKTVPCRVSYELIKSLIDEQDSLAMENAAFELKDGAQVGMDGCRIDAKVLGKVLDRLTNVDNGQMVDI